MGDTTRIADFDTLVDAVTKSGVLPRVAIARSAEGFVLKAGVEAYEKGIAEPILIGDEEKTREVADSLGLDISRFRMEHITDDQEAVTQACRMYTTGEASFIMKGLVATSTLLKAVLNKENGVPLTGNILSHTGVFQSPSDGKLMIMSDPGVNIKPNLQRKADIIHNALWVARKLGIEQPRVAVLAATEKVNYPAMPATQDADILRLMGEHGTFGDAHVAGPLSLDLAISPTAAECKGVGGKVAGCADVLITPDIESGNVLYKSLSTFCGCTMAGVVVGSSIPVVVPSRGDSDKTKFYSIALAAYLSTH